MDKQVTLHDKTFHLYKSESEILAAVKNIADKINEDYIGRQPLLVPVLNGAFMFASDLVKELKLDCEVCFIKAASYNGLESNGDLKTIIGLNDDLKDRHVILVEDIVDSGHTLSRLIPEVIKQRPSSLKIAALIYKPNALKNQVKIDYTGMEIPNDFIVGYGLDYNGLGRNLRDIYQLVE